MAPLDIIDELLQTELSATALTGVIGALEEGHSVGRVAAAYGLQRGLVRRIRSAFRPSRELPRFRVAA